ncbi:MAG: PhoX family phosphatase [Hydrogenophaga sp.]|nr:PhoX family phosphatase [Hydrogenophaga sp.]
MSDRTDEMSNFSDNEHFREVLDRARSHPVSRRMVVQGGVGLTALGSLPMLNAAQARTGNDREDRDGRRGRALDFDAVAKSVADEVMLPPGYTFTVLHATGDRLSPQVPAYSNAGTESDDWSLRVGDHHDGMDLFYIDRQGRYTDHETDRAVLVVNHESSADAHFFHAAGQTSNGVPGKKFSQFGDWDLGTRPELEALKEMNHHGVSIVEVRFQPGEHDGKGMDGRRAFLLGKRRENGGWTYQVNSIYNRRVNGQTPMRIAGPAAHLADIQHFMVTKFDPTGASSRGTLNNCGHGKTPWGTFLACEENWAFYFNMPAGSAAVDAKTAASRARYGVARTPLTATASSGVSQGWYTVTAANPADQSRFDRWNISAPGATAAEDYRNEPNTFGYVVEIDPLRNTTPAKRVTLGRFAHEAAVFGLPKPGQPLAVYMGCDSRNEYIYKFVSEARWNPRDEGQGIAAGNKYLDEGHLYVAKFHDDGHGDWIELSINNPLIANYASYAFANQADVWVNARHAASAVGGTKMDRPEWGAVNPKNGEIYFTLTNNSTLRNLDTTDGANPRAYKDADGRAGSGNPNGHIIRFREEGRVDATSLRFRWDVFLFGAEADAGAQVNLSGLSADNDFSSPDGLWFSKASGICWIQTDDGAYTDVSNCMLLAAIPGKVGDGQAITVDNSLNGATGTQNTFIGAALGQARLRRFMVAPKGAEVTGLTESADGKALFVNIQHPGENTPALGSGASFAFESQWPGNAGYGVAGRPRSATIVITREDGGVIGL